MLTESQPRIHFVYSVPYGKRMHGRFLSPVEAKARSLLREVMPPGYRKGSLPEGHDPLPAPYSITRHLFDYLSERHTTVLYDWRENRDIVPRPGDVLLGHPHPDPSTIVNRAFKSDADWRARVLIFPLHHGLPAVNMYAMPMLERADAVLGIMGKYWYDTIDSSFLAPFKPKLTRLDMAIDSEAYPLVKRTFNPPGKRGLLYIGSNRPEKGTAILSETMLGLNDQRRSWIGWGEEIPGMTRIASHLNLTPTTVATLAQDHDIFVTTSVSDANPTTILEAMAWGFPVACTPESGYYDIPTIPRLSATDAQYNVEALERLQALPVEDLAALSLQNRSLVENFFTWERFCTSVWNRLELLLG